MLQSKDLRVGNKIYNIQGVYNNDTDDFDFPEIDKLEITVDLDVLHRVSFQSNYEVFEPILLTPEILKSWGFEQGNKKYNNEHVFTLRNIIIEAEEKGYGLFGSEWTIGKTFHFIHELQNIIYFLFGEEIEVNL